MGCLLAGCTYQVRIRAQNSSGWGQYCLPTEVKSAPGVPHAPGVPRGTSRNPACIDMEWEAPQHDGGTDIASYRLEMLSGKTCQSWDVMLHISCFGDCTQVMTPCIAVKTMHQPACLIHVVDHAA